MELITKIDKNLDKISDEVKALRVKGDKDATEQEAKLKDLKAEIQKAADTHAAHDTVMKSLVEKSNAIDKSIAELDLRTKNMNLIKAGLVDGAGFRKLHKEAMADFAACRKTEGAHAVNLKMRAADFYELMLTKGMNNMTRKAAGNMTESGNFDGDFVIAPDRLPGFFAPPLRPVHIREFINQSATESNLINYTTLTSENDGSGSTAQGSAAAQSDFTLTAQQCIVQKINTYFTVAKEMLEDTPVTENYIRVQGVGRLMMFEDTALLTGNGVAPNQYGIIPVASAYANPVIPGTSPTNPPNYYDILMAAVTQAKVAYYVPNYIIVHPNDYNIMVTSRDNYGRYQFFQAVSGQAGAFYVNGALVVQNTAITQGTFLVGDFEQGATLFFKDEIEITFSNQHVDNFIKGFITVMIEERCNTAIYRPTAFVTGTFNQGIISGS